MLRRLYDWTLSLAAHRHAIRWLAAVAFVESSVFPIPPDAMIVPMVLATRRRAWRIAAVATLASVLGGLAGYAIGALFYETVGARILAFYDYGESFARFREIYLAYGTWIVLGAGLTPFPYKVVTIASGLFALDPVVFAGASLLGRGLRFFAEAALLWRFGPAIRAFVEARLGLIAAVFFALLVGGFAALGWLG